MSFADDAAEAGRRPLVVVEIDSHVCTRSYGVAPCTAAGEPAQACFNTFGTCQDRAHFAATTRTWRFSELLDAPPEVEAIPCVDSVSFAAAQIEPGGLGSRASVSVAMRDFPFADTLGSDPYLADRAAPPRGTFWGRWLARNPHWLGRTLRIREGYISRPFSFANFRTREYVIESISGPDRSGKVKITAKDVLKLADDNRAQAPAATTNITLASTITNSATTIVLSDGTDFVAGDRIALEKEVVVLGTKSTNTFTSCTRAADGTTADAHDADTKVQKCLRYAAENVRDVLEDLLVNYAGIDAGYIDSTGWDDEAAASLATFDLTATIAKPTPVKTLVQELLQQCQVSIWWDDTAQLIRLRGETPFADIAPPLNDDEHFIAETVSADVDQDRQVTHVELYYGKRSPTEDDSKPENYSRVHVEIDTEAEGADAYGQARIVKIYSRWFAPADQSLAELAAQRLVDRFVDPPVVLTFSLDARHTERVVLGDVTDLTTRQIQDVNGDPRPTRAQVIKVLPKKHGHEYAYTALAYFAASDAVITNQTIAANVTNYDLFTALGGPTAPVTLTVTVNSGVLVTSNDAAKPAFDTSRLHPDSVVTIVNNGTICGHGGAGGDTTDVVGRPGGDAINLGCNAVIENNGQISGGGGGGTAADLRPYTGQIYGGGGGQGRVGGAGGAGTGGSGSSGTSGAPGVGEPGSPPGWTPYGPGTGGALGMPGGNGYVVSIIPVYGYAPYPAIAGGPAGAAVKRNGFSVTWTATGTRDGAY